MTETKDPDRDVWYLPRMGRRHWAAVVIIAMLGLPTTYMVYFLGSLVGSFILVYTLMVVWSGMRALHRSAV